MSDYPNERDCKHGRLARKCELCAADEAWHEQEDELQRLRADVARITALADARHGELERVRAERDGLQNELTAQGCRLGRCREVLSALLSKSEAEGWAYSAEEREDAFDMIVEIDANSGKLDGLRAEAAAVVETQMPFLTREDIEQAALKPLSLKDTLGE